MLDEEEEENKEEEERLAKAAANKRELSASASHITGDAAGIFSGLEHVLWKIESELQASEDAGAGSEDMIRVSLRQIQKVSRRAIHSFSVGVRLAACCLPSVSVLASLFLALTPRRFPPISRVRRLTSLSPWPPSTLL